MIHRAATFNVKKLERTSACSTKLSIGHMYQVRRCRLKIKHIGGQKKVKRRTPANKNPRRQKARTRRAFCCLVHSTGFEPVTARFVAEYSIQLSYECSSVFRPDHNWLKPSCLHCCNQLLNGALDRIRTCDRSVRSRVLYPAELRVHLLPRIIGRSISM